MTRRQVDVALRLWQHRLALDAWRIELVIDGERWDANDRGDCDASVWRSNDYDVARVYLNPSTWQSWADAELHEHLVHELLHLTLRDLEHVLDHVEPLLHADAHRIASEAHRHVLEQAVDRLARQFVELAGIPGGSSTRGAGGP